MSTFSQFAGSGIKSIQRGTITLGFGVASAAATITSVNTAKTELRMLGFSCDQPDAITGHAFPRISLTSSTQITASREPNANNSAVTVSWELTEFI